MTIESRDPIDYIGKDETSHAIAPNQPYPYFVTTNETRRSIGDKIQNDTATNFETQVRSEAQKNGIAVSSVAFDSLQYRWVETNRYTAYIFPMTPVTIYSEKYTLDMTVTVLSDKPFAASPMPLWVMKIIKWALELAIIVLIAYFTIQALQACFSSLFVKKQTVTIYNPDGTIKEQTITEEPAWTAGVLVIGGVLVVGVIAVMALPTVLEWLKGRKKRAPARRRK